MEKNPRLILKPGRERPLLRRHPWIFSGSVARVEGEPGSGATVEIISQQGQWLARASFSPQSQIRARVWSWQEDERIDESFFLRRFQAARQLRQELGLESETDAVRLVHAESDGLAGIVVDRYGGWGSIQLLSAGAEAWRGTIISCLRELGWFDGLVERSDVEVRTLEGLEERSQVVFGDTEIATILIQEAGNRYFVDLLEGQKTGFYLDQRANRRLAASRAQGKVALDAFCYSGGFTIAMLNGRAQHVTAIDSSSTSLALLRKNLSLNPHDEDSIEIRQADVFNDLRALNNQGRQFDLIVLDPPKFAPTRQQAQAAARGYKDINLHAFKLLRPGGELLTFSCSGGMDAELFQKVVADAALDAGRQARVVGWLSQAADHPIALAFPEGRYLKGLHCLVD
jgi:23S rRNA (cytosine1962-C5)-methyltransferase